MAIFETALGAAHPHTARCRSRFARLHLDADDPGAALAAGEAALAAHDAALGPKHTYTLDSARIVADALAALGRQAEANDVRTQYGLGSAA